MKLTNKQLKQLIKEELNNVLNESDQWYGKIPEDLWGVSDYSDARDEGILDRLGEFSDEDLLMKIDQLKQEIQYELDTMDDPQNQYDQSVAMKEALMRAIQQALQDRG